MSHIPNNAMPHAGGDPEHRQQGGLEPGGETNESGGGSTIAERAGKLRDKARGRPKTAIAAGVAITAGVVAAAAVPIARARRRAAEKGQEGGEGGEGGKSKKKKKD